MQKKRTPVQKSKYVVSGVPAARTPGGRKGSKARAILQLLIIGALVLAVVVAAVWGLSSLFRNSGKPVALNARPTDNIQPFGDSVLVYDGTMLSCINAGGSTKWTFALGPDADYTCTSTMVVAWSGNQLHVIDKNGNPTYNDRMSQPIRFGRVGEAYVAVCTGDRTQSTVSVMSLTGALLEHIPVEGLYVLDVGFFSKVQLLWVLSLDMDGGVPVSNLKTFEPGKIIMGGRELSDVLVYSVYPYNNLLMVVDTAKVQAYNYKCVEQTDISPLLVYGWSLRGVRAAGKQTYALFEPMPGTTGSETFSELRLAANESIATLRLLSPCFAGGLGEKGVYGFGPNVVFYAPYGQKAFKATYLTYTITDLICMLDGDRAVMAAGDHVFIMKLPT